MIYDTPNIYTKIEKEIGENLLLNIINGMFLEKDTFQN